MPKLTIMAKSDLEQDRTIENNNAILDKVAAKKFIRMRHPEYNEYVGMTRWILDTLEGGDRYRNEEYGEDAWGKPIRNLLRLQRELPIESTLGGSIVGPIAGDVPSGGRSPFYPNKADMAGLRDAADEVYEIRRQRTPVPNFLSNFVEKQLSKIYKRPISRDGGAEIMAWCDDIDGRDTSLNDWMREVIAPLICALGMIDVSFDHPVISPGEPPILGRETDPRKQCVARYYLPENVLWWDLDYTKRYYLEVIVREWEWDSIRGEWLDNYRHWTYEDWTLYNMHGEVIDGGFHPFGTCPVVRLFDRRNFRMDNGALCRMYPIADLSRAYYNEESEMIASMTLHNCPIVQGPADDAIDSEEDTSVPIGRNLILRKVVNQAGVESGYEYLEPSTKSYEFGRLRLLDLQTRMEAHAALTKSVGSVGAGGSQAISQSGISKAYDQAEGSDYLSSFARTLQVADYTVCQFATIVLFDGAIPDGYMDKLTVIYPNEFNLLSFSDVALIDETIQAHITNAAFATVPTLDKETLKMMARKQHPDINADLLAEIDSEIDKAVDDAAKKRQDDLKRQADTAAANLERLKNPPPPIVATDGTQPQPPTNGKQVPPVPLPKAPIPPLPQPSVAKS
jgi:hypothetical protein